MAYNPKRLFRVCTPGSELDVPEFQELYTAYSQAMWSWSRAENKLFIIFAFALSGNDPDVPALRELFFSVISPQARIDMIHAIAKIRWKKSGIWNDWVKLYEELKTQLSIRGKLAHLVGYAYYPKPKNKKAETLIMAPPWHPNAPVTHGQAKASGYDAAKLSMLASEWEKLSSRLGVFVALAEHEKQPQGIGLAKEYLCRLLHNPNDQTPAKLKPQLSASERKS